MLTFPRFEPRFSTRLWTLPHILEHRAAHDSSKPYLQWTDQEPALSFADVNAKANRLARGFKAMGVQKGDKVALFLPNCLEYILCWFALNKLGAAEVTIGDAFKGDFLVHQLVTSDTALMVTTSALINRIAAIEDRVSSLRSIIILNDPGEKEPLPSSLATIATCKFEELWSDDDSNLGVEIYPRDLAAVLFTSGTTGPSKAVMMPHSQITFKAEEIVQVLGMSADDVVMTSFPFFHANAQILSIYAAMLVGARCVLYRRFSASDWIGRARRSGATVTNLLGATMAFIAAHPARRDDRNHRLRAIYNAPTSPELAKLFDERFGIGEIVEGYGQTEISMPFLAPLGVKRPPGACGLLLDQWFEIRLVGDDTGACVADGGAGELWVRHKVPGIISDGFLGMPEKTLEAWRDLWFHTGDVMRRDADGWYYFVDRLKDALRRRGENISSFEVESVVRSHPSITECAVVATPADEVGGEDEVLACVIVEPGHDLDPVSLLDWCEERMPAFAVPRYLRVMDSFPKTPSEKIRKSELREAGVTAGTFDRQRVLTNG